jgi:hypothetical protein
MSAGHSNGVDLTNAMHVPFCIQIGEHDTLYGRHENAVRSGQRISILAAISLQDTYVGEVLLYAGSNNHKPVSSPQQHRIGATIV